MMNIVILTGSVRRGGNTDQLADAFIEGLGDRHHVERVSVADYNVLPCCGCNRCFEAEGHRCVQEDDMQRIYAKLAEADMLVIASPVYFYGISAQLKAIIDRLHTPMRDGFHIRKSALLLAGGSSRPEVFEAIVHQYQLCIKHFDIADQGMILAGGCRQFGDVAHTEAIAQVRQLGTRI